MSVRCCNVILLYTGEMCCTLKQWRDVWFVAADITWSQSPSISVTSCQWQCSTLRNILHQRLLAACTTRWCSLSSGSCCLSERFRQQVYCKLFFFALFSGRSHHGGHVPCTPYHVPHINFCVCVRWANFGAHCPVCSVIRPQSSNSSSIPFTVNEDSPLRR